MKVLVIGSGGREHVLIWKLAQSSRVKEIYCAPGNGGIAGIARCVDIQAGDIRALVEFAKHNSIDLTVVGPEAPLVEGIVDVFEKNGLKVFGPSAQAAQLEGSKVFSKEFMQCHDIPMATFEVFEDVKEANKYLTSVHFPVVIKADGLASGKGVVVCQNIQEAKEALDDIMVKKVHQSAGNKVVIEECLKGEEASILAISDGNNFVLLESSQDHKRIFDDDVGPNTGGMGAYSPAPVVSPELLHEISSRVIEPTIKGMKQDGIPFKGVLYAGIMITKLGPYVLEYNVRFGDPEAQAVLPRLKTDLFDVMLASSEEKLKEVKLTWDRRDCVCVVMSSGGYPGSYEKNKEITGIEDIKDKQVMVFHAGTVIKDGRLLTAGGRVLGVTALGNGIEDAIGRAYQGVEKIKFERSFFRRDIGARALKKSNAATRR